MDLVKFGVLLAVTLSWFAEVRLHARNAKFLLSQGATPFGKNFYRVYYILVCLSAVTPFIDEIFALDFFRWPPWITVLFTVILLLSSTFRWIAIDSINQIWTLTGFQHRDLRRWSVGPYRYINHPEFLSRLVDAFCFFFIFCGGGLTCSVLFGLLLITLKLVQVEMQAYGTAAYDFRSS